MEYQFDIQPLALSHAEPLTKWFNTFVDQDLGVVENFHVTIESEATYISNYLDTIVNSDPMSYVIFSDGQIVGKSDFRPLTRDIDKHVVELGYGLVDNSEHAGVALLTFMVDEAKKRGFEVALYFILARNQYFRDIFAKVGFSEVGEIKKFYKRNDAYDARIILEKLLSNTA